MSVTVTRSETKPPPQQIVAADDIGDTLTFSVAPFVAGRDRLEARVKVTGPRLQYIRITPDDARDLARALVEWADSVEA